MKKILFLTVLVYANFNFSSDADISESETIRNKSFTSNRSEEQLTVVHHVHKNNEGPRSALAATVSIAMLSLIIIFSDAEEMAVRSLGVDCDKPFNKSDCNDSDEGCAYRECVATAFCNDSDKNCTKHIQLPGCNLTRKQRRALEKCHAGKPLILYKNYARQNPQGYAQQECLKKSGHYWDNRKKNCRFAPHKNICSPWHVCQRRS